jgi:hypothetical protein
MRCYLQIRKRLSKSFWRFTGIVSRLIAVLAVIGFSGWVWSVSAQPQKRDKPKTNVRLVKTQPSVFISFDHEGKREPLKTGESSNGVWLRLHNNTRAPLFFPTFSVPSALGQLGMFYDIVSVSDVFNYHDGAPPAAETKTRGLPVGYTLGHTSSAYLLQPGRSVLFSLPREHLPEGVTLRINFNYAWELEGKMESVRIGEPEHYVYFYSSQLPKSPQQSKK